MGHFEGFWVMKIIAAFHEACGAKALGSFYGPPNCERVKEAMGELQEPVPAEAEAVAVERADELLEADPLDPTHLFFEELRRIGRALREVRPEELTF